MSSPGVSGTALCDRCGDPATEYRATGEAYCDECAEWRMDLELESKGLDTSSPGDVLRAERAAAMAEATRINEELKNESLRGKQRSRKQAGPRT